MFLFLSNNQVMRTVFYQAVVVVVADVVEVVGAGVDGVAKLIVTEGKTSVHASANSNCSVARKATTKIKTNEVERNIFLVCERSVFLKKLIFKRDMRSLYKAWLA